MKAVSLRWHLAAAVLLVSLLSVAAGAGATLVAGHARSQAEADAAVDIAAAEAQAEISALWHETHGRLLALSSALGDNPSNASFGLQVAELGLLDGTIVFVRYAANETVYQRPFHVAHQGPVVAHPHGAGQLKIGIDAAVLHAIVSRRASSLPPSGSIAWASSVPAPADGFGGGIVASSTKIPIVAVERGALIGAAGTGIAIALTSAGGAALAATLLVRPLRRFEVDARALAEGRPPVSGGGPKELAVIAASMRQAAEEVARDRHDLHVAQEKLGAALRKQTKEARDQEARVRRLFEGISHDIKGPLITANVLLQQVQREAAPGQESLDRALAALHRLRALVQQLSLLSHASTSPTMAPFDLAPMVKQVAAAAREARPTTATLICSGPDIVVRTDSQRLRTALSMLIDNALRYGGNVRVHWGKGAVPWIRVEDDGPGFAFDPAMLEPFAVRSDQPGVAAGLGLPIAHRLVRSLGGGLQVTSSPAGTRCTMFLPGGR